MNKTLVYIANIRLPTEKAHGTQIMSMCSAFAENDCDVTLVVPRRLNKITSDPYAYYGIQPTFRIVRIPCIDLLPVWDSKISFLLQTATFIFCAYVYLWFKRYDLLYTREQFVGFLFSGFFLEIHSLPKRITAFHVCMWRKAKGLVVLTSFIKERLKAGGVPENKIIVSPDGVNFGLFDFDMSKSEAREKLHLPKEKKIVGYVGMLRTLGTEKGIDSALSALAGLPPDTMLLLVGGSGPDVGFYKDMADSLGVSKNVRFVGKVPHKEIPLYLKACDVLIAPFPENEHYSYFMSPLKIFEYMASKRPMVVSNLPSIREVLSEQNAVLVSPGDIDALAFGITKLLNDAQLSEKISGNAFLNSVQYTWQKRARHILDFAGTGK